MNFQKYATKNSGNILYNSIIRIELELPQKNFINKTANNQRKNSWST